MARRLKENVDKLARVEKYASAAIVVIRVGRELRDPLNSLRNDTNELASTGQNGATLGAIAANLDRNLREIDRSLKGLSETRNPDEWLVSAPQP